MKHHKSGDISLVTSRCVIGEDVDTFIRSGQLVLPISFDEENIKVFIPCEGIDADIEEVPAWADEVKLTEIIPGYDVKDVPNLRVRAQGKMTGVRGSDFTTIKSQQVEPGDFLACRGGEIYEIWSVADNAFFPEGTRDSIRLKRNFVKNVNKQPFDIIKVPKLRGKIYSLKQNIVDFHNMVTIQLHKINSDDFGTLKISYRNACFNSFGFLTHDGHIFTGSY